MLEKARVSYEASRAYAEEVCDHAFAWATTLPPREREVAKERAEGVRSDMMAAAAIAFDSANRV